MESDLAGLHFSIFLIDLIANQDNRDIVANSCQIFVPFRYVFVSNSGGNIEHEDGGISANIVTLTQTSQLFLASGVPKWEFDRAMVGVKSNRADLNSLSGYILLLEFSCDVPFNERGLADSTVSDQDDLEFRNDFGCSLHLIYSYLHKLMTYLKFEILKQSSFKWVKANFRWRLKFLNYKQ